MSGLLTFNFVLKLCLRKQDFFSKNSSSSLNNLKCEEAQINIWVTGGLFLPDATAGRDSIHPQWINNQIAEFVNSSHALTSQIWLYNKLAFFKTPEWTPPPHTHTKKKCYASETVSNFPSVCQIKLATFTEMKSVLIRLQIHQALSEGGFGKIRSP